MYTRSSSISVGHRSFFARALRKLKEVLGISRNKPVMQFRTFMQVCTACHGVTPCHEYSFEDLLGIYHDYRLDSYKKDRIALEPWYKNIADEIGSHPLELKNRNSAVDGFLRRNASHFLGTRMIDYGGGDGRFIPPFAFEQFDRIDILDASIVPIHTSVDAAKAAKIKVAEPLTYNFLTCMHLLEHVGNPREFTVEMLRLLAPGGLIYIEVPLELNAKVHEDCAQKVIDTPIAIHEHINLFDRTSMLGLIKSIQELELLDDTEEAIDLGWIVGYVGRFLARKVV